MPTQNPNERTLTLGEIVEAAYALASTVASDPATVAEMATRHLERVLVRGDNARLLATLADVGRDLGPPASYAWRPGADARWANAQLAVAR